MRLLLLDFDGVLNGTAHFTSPEFLAATEGLGEAEVMLLARSSHLERAKVVLVNRVVEASGAAVVISSSWRLGYTLDELNEMLASRGASFRAVALTPRVTSYDPSKPLRAREIVSYLDALATPPESVVALDDDDLGGMVPGHIRTESHLGLQEHHVEACLRAFGFPASPE